MSNMSYCRFENTASDLRDCLDHFDEERELDKTEQAGRDEIIEMAEEIYDNYMDLHSDAQE